jgi:IS30 family transposase
MSAESDGLPQRCVGKKKMQKQSHRHLREEDRKIIYRMRKAGKTQQEIADVLGVSQGTISKELRRNRGKRGYRPRQAQKRESLSSLTAKIIP